MQERKKPMDNGELRMENGLGEAAAAVRLFGEFALW